MTKNVTRPFVLADGIPTTLELFHSCVFILQLAKMKEDNGYTGMKSPSSVSGKPSLTR
jgi:hypothetical protein